jgi:8-oxo-dGTP diphosphatase
MSHTYEYPLPAVTVDMVIFTIDNGELKVLLIRRRDDPFKDHLALPGGFVEVGVGHKSEGEQGESVYEAAVRELREETSLDVDRDDIFLEQLYTFGEPGRDPRGRVISVAYYALMSPESTARVRAGDDAVEAEWRSIWHFQEFMEERPDKYAFTTVDAMPCLAFDHGKILKMAVDRIRGKMDYDPRLARALLPEKFTQKQFRRVHEVVKGVTYDRSNFSRRFRRMLEDGRFVESNETAELPGGGRPPKLYTFSD